MVLLSGDDMNEKKIREVVLFLVAVILVVFIVRYTKIIYFIKKILTILVPVFIGFVYAWLFNPLIKKLDKKNKRGIISVLVFFGVVFIVLAFLYFLIPVFYKEISELIEILPELFNNIENKINNMGLKDSLDNILIFLVDNVPMYLVSFVKGLFKYLGVIGIGLILGLYMSMDYEKMVKMIYDIVPKKHKCVVINLSQEVSEEVRKCVNGTLFVAFCVFVMDSLAFFLVGLDAPLLFGALCGITDLIPYVGPYIGGIAAVCVGFTESKLVGILTIILCVVVQSIENYILQPIVMSKSIKISPVLIIIGLLVFGNLFGVVGMILATPCVAMMKVIVEHIGGVLEKCKE